MPPNPDARASAAPDPVPEGLWLEQPQSVAEERVLAEIAHELGNFFHKLYYWAEFLQEKRADHSSEATAAQMLTHTIGNLEQFLKGTLEYFRPLKLSPSGVPAADLIAGMVVQLRAELHGWPVSVSDAGRWEQRSVLIDPARLPAVWLAVGRRLTERAPAGSGVHVAVDVRADGLEAVFQVEGSLGVPGFQTAAACIEWALAERIVALHGGRLEERAAADAGLPRSGGGGGREAAGAPVPQLPALVLVLPLQH